MYKPSSLLQCFDTEKGEIFFNETQGNAENDNKIVINLPGAWTNSEANEEFDQEAAQEGITTYSIDFFGHGPTPKPNNRWLKGTIRIKDQVFAVEELIKMVSEKENISPAEITLMGHSMGAFIAHKYLEKDNAEIKKAILLAPPQIGGVLQATLSYIAKYFPKSLGYFAQSIFTLNLEHLAKNPQIARNLLLSNEVESMEGYEHLAQFESLISFLGMTILEWRDIDKVQSKVRDEIVDLHLLIAGNDNTFDVEKSKIYGEKLSIPKNQIIVCDGAPHHMMIGEIGKETRKTVRDIINDEEALNIAA